MNFLAHFVLSYPDRALMAGNFIADFLGKKEQDRLDPVLLPGLQMHRWIDQYTDTHARISEINAFFRPAIRHYAPVASDIVMDHLLYCAWERHGPLEFGAFSRYAYDALMLHDGLFPERPRRIAHRMIEGDWLRQYRTVEGLTEVMHRMNGKAAFEVDFTRTIPVLQEHFGEMNDLFLEFFGMAREASREWISLRNEGRK